MDSLHPQIQKLAYAAGLALLVFLTACGGGGGGGAPATTNVDLATLSGIIHRSTPSGSVALEGVTVSIDSSQGTLSALTNGSGTFIIPSIGLLPVGTVHVAVDGSTAQATGALAFPKLELMVPLVEGMTDLVLPQLIVLPDLNSLESANQNLPLSAGVATEAIEVVQGGGPGDISLSGPVGTVITSKSLDGSEVGIDLNLTPVPLAEVPMPLPDGWSAGDFVTIQPGSASFDPPGDAVGLDIVLPNSLGLPVGTEVDIWSFDHDDGEWVNRSEQTGNKGIVVDVILDSSLTPSGTRIEAFDVITEGGWHAAGIIVDVECATTFTGSVEDGLGVGIANASIAFSTGQFAFTDVDGNFTSGFVPAYDQALFQSSGICEGTSIGISVVLPPNLGGEIAAPIVVDALDIVLGGVTSLDPFVFAIPNTGSLTGLVIGEHAPGEQVVLTPDGGSPMNVELNQSDAFFVTGLSVGNGIASFLFSGESEPTEAPYSIALGQISSVTLQHVPGTGEDNVTVLVLYDHDDNEYSDMIPVGGASVRLQGTDTTSQAGLVMVTDGNGQAIFQDVTGPFTVTAQKDLLVSGLVFRAAASVIEVTPVNDTIGILFFGGSDFSAPTYDALISGHVSNLGGLPSGTVMIRAREAGVDAQGFDEVGFANGSGDYSISIPSGKQVDVSFELIDFSEDSQVLASMILPGAGQAGPGGTLVVDADFDNAVLWDQSVDVSLSNVAPGFSSNFDFRLSDEAGTEFEFRLASNEFGNDVTLMLPDLADPKLLGFEGSVLGFTAQPKSFDDVQECEVYFSTTPSVLNINFLGVPGFVTPGLGDNVLASAFESSTVTFTENSAGENPKGLNVVSIGHAGGATPGGVDAVFWSVYLPAGVSTFDMPLTALPMFVANSEFYFEVEKFRLEGYIFEYAKFFSGNLQAEFDLLATTRTVDCGVYNEMHLELD